jgi:hypothetical protein
MTVYRRSAPAAVGETETAPLLLSPDSEVSFAAFADSDGEDAGFMPRRRASDAANQSVGPGRATLLILGMWVLIFLQGLYSMSHGLLTSAT